MTIQSGLGQQISIIFPKQNKPYWYYDGSIPSIAFGYKPMNKQELTDLSFGSGIAYDGSQYLKYRTNKRNDGTVTGISVFEKESGDAYTFQFFDDVIHVSPEDETVMGIAGSGESNVHEFTECESDSELAERLMYDFLGY